jgi:hypothetical protein
MSDNVMTCLTEFSFEVQVMSRLLQCLRRLNSLAEYYHSYNTTLQCTDRVHDRTAP